MAGTESLLVQTSRRLNQSDHFEPPIFICNNDHRFLVAQALRDAELSAGPIILEPCPRNTAPAVVASALVALEKNPDALLLFLPSDHLIKDEVAFRKAVNDAAPATRAGKFVCFGVKPSRPETGFGYIAAGDVLEEAASCRMVERFIEKPDYDTASTFVSEGNYLWNAGIFLFSGPALLKELESFEPELVETCRKAVADAVSDLDFLRLDEDAFSKAKGISIDHALMERTASAAVADASFDWSDLGSYSALLEASPKDGSGNTLVGDVITQNTRGSYLYSESQLLAAIGVEDLAIVAMHDAVLVAPMQQSDELKHLVTELKAQGREEADHHATVHRPWGSYRTIIEGPRYLVKEIVVQPGRRLSGQYHHHRAEHWVVVEGVAEIQRDDEKLTLKEDQSLYIPLGAVHRLKNPGTTPLRLIEVQTGSYLAEDDIVRLDDDYGRLEKTSSDSD
jgi:mannose-1-phosphate guanylyltransferase/mannose-6-phosphate isomerase